MMRMPETRLTSLSGGVLLSLFVHGLIAAALLIDLPWSEAEAEPEEQVVAVTLVEPPAPEPEPETPQLDAPEPETPEAGAETPPEPEAAAPEPPPEPEAAAPEPPPAESETAEGEGVPIPVLRPVFQFGEEDSGPELALDGGAAEAPAEEVPEDQPEEPVAEPEPEAAAQTQPEAGDPVDEPPRQDVAALAMPADITLPDAVLAGEAPGNLPDAADQTVLALLPEDPTDAAPEPNPAEPVEPDEASADAPEIANDPGTAAEPELTQARELFSTSVSGNKVAMAAMGKLPREARGSQLCTTELREQLRNGATPYRPELLPSYSLPGGTVLTVPNAAFRAGGDWYDLSFRCTVDADALKVTGFAYKVGDVIPRSKWKARGFPDF